MPPKYGMNINRPECCSFSVWNEFNCGEVAAVNWLPFTDKDLKTVTFHTSMLVGRLACGINGPRRQFFLYKFTLPQTLCQLRWSVC